MKGKISVCVIVAIGFIIFLIYGSSTIYGMRNQVVANEETMIGDVNAATGVNLALEYIDNSEIGWNVNYRIGNSIQTDAAFKTYYYNNYRNDFAPRVYFEGLYGFESEFFDKIEGDVGEITIPLADYYEYLPINLHISYNKFASKGLLGDNNIYKIKMPKDATLHIKKEYNSYSSEPISVPYVDATAPSVMINGKIYFSITNMENHIYYEKSSQNSIEYQIKSGILAIENKETLSFDDIEFIYPINLENDGTTTVLGLTSMKEDKYLALATMEEQSIYIHLYDVKNNVLIKKEKVGEIPSNMTMNQFDLINQGDYLLANYEYYEEDDTESWDTLKVVGAVYNITDTNEIKCVLENEYYTKLVDEMKENYYSKPKDMLFMNNKLHLVFRNYSSNSNEELANSIVLLTMDADEILYHGIIRNNMIEDYTIGDVTYSYYTMSNEEVIVRNRARDITNVNFIR